MASGVLYPIFWLSMYYLLYKPADFEFPREKIRLALETEGGVTKLDGQLVTHAFMRILSSQRLRVRSTLVHCLRACLCIQSVSTVSLWLYCHRFGVNSHSVAVIATGYLVA